MENARHGMLHIRLIWMSLSSVYDDLKLAFRELEILGTTTLNTAILSVFIDSAKNLPVSIPFYILYKMFDVQKSYCSSLRD